VPCDGSPDEISAVNAIAASPAKAPEIRCAPIRTIVIGTQAVQAARSSDPIRRRCVKNAVAVNNSQAADASTSITSTGEKIDVP